MITKIRNFKGSDLPSLFELLKEPDDEQRLLYIHYGEAIFFLGFKNVGLRF